MLFGTYVSRHLQTAVGSLGRLVRRPFASFMTIGVIGLALALPLMLNLFLSNVRTVSGDWTQAFALSVYLDKSASRDKTSTLAAQVRRRAEVSSVRIVTSEEALADFRKNSGFGGALDALGENPLPDVLIVTPALAASTPEGTQSLRAYLASLPDVGSVELDTDWVKRLQALLDLLRRVLMLTGALLGIGVVFIVGNTIRLDIENRRAEIEVMKLVGATDRFTRRPFLYSGAWYGLGGGILALAVVDGAVLLLEEPVRALAHLYGSAFELKALPASWCGAVVFSSVALAWLGSWFAATRHIRQIEPD